MKYEKKPPIDDDSIEGRLASIPQNYSTNHDANFLSRFDKYTLSEKEVEEIAEAEFIIDGLIPKGQSTIICAEPNGGKTTIFFHLAGEMRKKGFDVIYVNADCSAIDAKPYSRQAKQMDIAHLVPDMKAGKSMEHVINDLRELNNEAHDLSNTVFIFDTLKKMADMINKSSIKNILGLFRSLTGKGATIISLAHANKYKGRDGQPIYEGTGDVRADVDNLIYLISEKHDDRSMTVSAEPDKERAVLRSVSFKIDPNRKVTLLSKYENINEKRDANNQRDKDDNIITAICEAIGKDSLNQTEIVRYCSALDISRNSCLGVLNRYESQLWITQAHSENNAKKYVLVKGGGKQRNS